MSHGNNLTTAELLLNCHLQRLLFEESVSDESKQTFVSQGDFI